MTATVVLLAVAAALCAGGASAATLTRVVQTRYGKLQGVVRTVDVTTAASSGPTGGGGGSAGRPPATVDTFLGVPYATPPVGSNRFGPTRTPSPWDGVRLADAPGPVCPQRLPDVSNETAALQRMPVGRLFYLKRLLPYLRNQSEDCLYLNIYAPSQGQCSFSGVRAGAGRDRVSIYGGGMGRGGVGARVARTDERTFSRAVPVDSQPRNVFARDPGDTTRKILPS